MFKNRPRTCQENSALTLPYVPLFRLVHIYFTATKQKKKALLQTLCTSSLSTSLNRRLIECPSPVDNAGPMTQSYPSWNLVVNRRYRGHQTSITTEQNRSAEKEAGDAIFALKYCTEWRAWSCNGMLGVNAERQLSVLCAAARVSSLPTTLLRSALLREAQLAKRLTLRSFVSGVTCCLPVIDDCAQSCEKGKINYNKSVNKSCFIHNFGYTATTNCACCLSV